MEERIGYVHSLESFGSADGPGVRYIIFLEWLQHALPVLPQSGHLGHQSRKRIHGVSIVKNCKQIPSLLGK